ncbi:hypothetical protein BUALT_Bualt16G0116000 [Buddleja alternifolia]|uniref:C3H1-type domain-containing protein n=1 Tax=Buddleja alternifolia TaxID=168488 RepID=A0AAV6WLH3_9LAMI|nr:hypothetical protein BUALT_Bualt16G0116000 [Buddleja alternifolia]
MSYPDPTPPPHQYISPPFSGGDSGGFWPPFTIENQNPDLVSQLDRSPFRRSKISENPSNFTPFQPMNPRTNPPNVNKGTSHIFFKTRICAKFMEGTCKNGDNCSFAHGAHDLREPPPNWQDIIREKDRVAGNGNWGDDHRMIHRMKICKKYYNGEECPYGEKCNFLHERPFPPLVKKFKADFPFEQRESSAISIGVTVDKGSSSDFDQTFFRKTKLCSKWEMGQCPFGERCHFAHGQSDLRFSGSLDEADVVINTGAIPRKALSASAFNTAPANMVIGAPPNADEEQKKTSKWKLTKKINRIYADWLDDMTPPYCSPNKEEM